MQFQLANPERVGFIIVAGATLTFDEPGPVEIDVESLPLDQKNQLLYNCRRGVLACGEPDELIRMCESLVSVAKSYSTPDENPINPTTPPPIVDVVDPVEEDLKELKTMLKLSVETIKSKVVDLSPSRTRKLLELEVAGKSRKGLKTFLNEILAKYAQGVLDSVGDEDVGDKYSLTTAGQIGSKQVSDVVESDLEQVVLNSIEDTEK